MNQYLRQRIRFFCIILLFATFFKLGEVRADAFQQTDSILQDCSPVAEEGLQNELNTITQKVVATAADKINVPQIVESQWRVLKVDGVIGAAVDLAVEQIKNEKDFWDKLLSAWSTAKAEELATAIVNRTFDAEVFRTQIDELSNAIALELTRELRVLSAQATVAAFFCLQTYTTGNYSSALEQAFEEEVRTATSDPKFLPNEIADTDLMTVISQHKSILGSVGVTVVAQMSKRIMIEIGETIAERLDGRIVDRVLGETGSAINPIASWLIGASMFAYDSYRSRDDALFQIAETLKSPGIKAGIRSEITASSEPELRRGLPQIAREISNQLYSEWRDVKRNIRQIEGLADENPTSAQTTLQGEIAYGKDGDIWLLDLFTHESQQLTTDGNNRWPAWSSDGRYLLYTHGNMEETADLYMLEVGQSEPRLLVENACCAAWEPDDDRVAYITLSGNDLVIEAVRPDGSGKETLFAPLLYGRSSWPTGNMIWVCFI